MDLKMNLDLKTMPVGVKIGLIAVGLLAVSALMVVFLILPKYTKIQQLKAEVTKQENEIKKDQAKAARLATLILVNEKLKKRLNELKLQLPEEKEVTSLLKQVSDLGGVKSGLKIVSWKPEQKKDHPSGTIYEIPVSVELSGTYHNLGTFFSSLTKLNRIVNISDLKISDPKAQTSDALLRIIFKATTFSAIPENEIAQGEKKK